MTNILSRTVYLALSRIKRAIYISSGLPLGGLFNETGLIIKNHDLNIL